MADFIPVCEPLLAGNELKYVTEAVSTGWISSSGKYVTEFENQFAKYCDCQYGVAVCNGTIALHLALLALGIGKGDEVIIPTFTMIASAFAVCYTGAKPFSDIAGFSFFANKNITTGEGGMVVTSKKEVYDRARYFKNVCFPLDGPRNYQHEDIGYNYRMSNVVAAIGLAQVEKADDYRAMRIRNHQLYRKYLKDVPGIIFQAEPAGNCVDVCWMNTIVINPELYGHTKQKALLDFGCDGTGEYPVCEWLTENGFYLPSGSGLKESEIICICRTIGTFSK